MYSFCPECGGSIDQEQVEGQVLVCKHCGHHLGVVTPAPKPQVVDQSEELVRSGKAARCPLCQQLVEVRSRDAGKTFVPHYTGPGQKKPCPNSGKVLPAEPEPPPAAPAAVPATASATPVVRGPGGKDLTLLMTREVIRVVACRRDSGPTIEELTLQYLDKADRVRVHIEGLRDILGLRFRMTDYPRPLNRPHLAVWGNADLCVVARRHEQGGYLPMSQAEVLQVVEDLKQHRQLFFP